MGRARHRSTAELRNAAKHSFFSSDDRVNDLCNNALGYYEKYREDVPKGLIETAYVNFWTSHHILFNVIPAHPGYAQFCAKKTSSFKQVYEELKVMVQTDIEGDVAHLQEFLDSRDSTSEIDSRTVPQSADDVDSLHQLKNSPPKVDDDVYALETEMRNQHLHAGTVPNGTGSISDLDIGETRLAADADENSSAYSPERGSRRITIHANGPNDGDIVDIVDTNKKQDLNGADKLLETTRVEPEPALIDSDNLDNQQYDLLSAEPPKQNFGTSTPLLSLTDNDENLSTKAAKHLVHRRPVGSGDQSYSPNLNQHLPAVSKSSPATPPAMPDTPPPPPPVPSTTSKSEEGGKDLLAARFERLRGPRPLLERKNRNTSPRATPPACPPPPPPPSAPPSVAPAHSMGSGNVSSSTETSSSAYSPYMPSSIAGTTNLTNSLVEELNSHSNLTYNASSSHERAQFYGQSPNDPIPTQHGADQSAPSVVSGSGYHSPVVFPKSAVISAEALEKYLRTVPDMILIIDVRDRRSFDKGHIAAPNIVCIEPAGLRDDMNDQSLEDSLIVGPDSEQALFSRRSSFELVVYCDADSRSNRGPGPVSDFRARALYTLNSAIYARAFSHPLKRPPCLLIGGFESWTEAFGDYLVARSETASPRRQRSNTVADVSIFPSESSPSMTRYRSNSRPSTATEFQKQQQNRLYNQSMNNGPVTPPQEIRSRDSYDFSHAYGPLSPDVSGGSPTVGSYPVTSGGGTAGYAKDYNDYFRNFSSLPQNSMPHYPVHSGRPPYPVHSSGALPMQMPLPNYVTKPRPTASSQSSFQLSRGPVLQSPPNYMAALPPPSAVSSDSVNNTTMMSTQNSIAGLRNLGNTCYMNCILQCLIGTAPISVMFADNTWKHYVNVNSKLGFKGMLAQRYAELVQTMIRDNVASVGPHALKNLLGRLRDTFQGYDQQDCQEFLTFILDGLHEELNANGDKDPLKQPTAEEERRREKMSVRVASTLEWERYMKSDMSPIVHTVQGQYQSKLRCLTCNHTSTTYNSFSSLSLPIPVTSAFNRRQVTLQDCFNLFTAEEILDGDDAWFCPVCKTRRKTVKVMHIVRLPKILIVHLKRFQQRQRGGGISEKLETFVTYPLKGLDLTPYWPNYRDGDEHALKGVPIRGQNAPFVYDLYAVANHFGTLKGGHYTAFVKKATRGWCYFDDVRVTKNVSPNESVNKHAYVLFFERREALR